MSEEYLEHHGIMGMKWGVRRTPAQLGHKKKAAQSKPKLKTDPNSSQVESLKKMSDEELRRRINRLQMERQYKSLTQKEISAGRRWVNSLLNDTSKQIASKYLTRIVTNAIDSKLGINAKSQQKK